MRKELSRLLESQLLSTGDLKEPSTQSRTKLNADHAGPSQLLPPSKDITTLELDISRAFPNKSSSLALTTAAKDAQVDGKPKPCDTFRPLVKSWSLNIHILPVTVNPEPAKREELLKCTFLESSTSQPTLLNN